VQNGPNHTHIIISPMLFHLILGCIYNLLQNFFNNYSSINMTHEVLTTAVHTHTGSNYTVSIFNNCLANCLQNKLKAKVNCSN